MSDTTAPDGQQMLKRLAAYVKHVTERGNDWLPREEFAVQHGVHNGGPGSWTGAWLKWGPLAGFYQRRIGGKEMFSLEIDAQPVWTGNLDGKGVWHDTNFLPVWLDALEAMVARIDEIARPVGRMPEQLHQEKYRHHAEVVRRWLASRR